MNPELAELARQVRAKAEEVNAARGKQAERLQAELSEYIVQQVQALMGQGLSVVEIQDALRAAVDDMVPQTYAPDADDSDHGEELEPPVSSTAYFLPMKEAVIAAFAAGELDEKAMIKRICASDCIAALEMTEGLDLVLTDFGKNPDMEDVCFGGEIVAGSGGEAFMPEYLDVKQGDEYRFSVCEPMVFKSAEEVKAIDALLEPVTEKAFTKKADIKKLIKSGWLDAYDKRSIKENAGYIIEELWKEFAALRETYRKAVEQGKGMAIFMGYEGDS